MKDYVNGVGLDTITDLSRSRHDWHLLDRAAAI